MCGARICMSNHQQPLIRPLTVEARACGAHGCGAYGVPAPCHDATPGRGARAVCGRCAPLGCCRPPLPGGHRSGRAGSAPAVMQARPGAPAMSPGPRAPAGPGPQTVQDLLGPTSRPYTQGLIQGSPAWLVDPGPGHDSVQAGGPVGPVGPQTVTECQGLQAGQAAATSPAPPPGTLHRPLTMTTRRNAGMGSGPPAWRPCTSPPQCASPPQCTSPPQSVALAATEKWRAGGWLADRVLPRAVSFAPEAIRGMAMQFRPFDEAPEGRLPRSHTHTRRGRVPAQHTHN